LTRGDDADVVLRSMTPSNLPLLVKLDIGSDGGSYDYNSGLSTTTVTLDIKDKLQTLVNSPPASVIQFTDDYGNQMVNISMLLEITGPGKVKIDGLDIVYEATLTTRNINEHLNEYLINRKDTAVNGQITVPMTLTAQNDAKIKLSNINIEYGIKPRITLITPVTGRTDALENYFDINWTDYDPDDDAQIALYYDDDKKGYDGTLIVENLTELDEVEEDSYRWTWTSDTMDDGDYYVYASITDGLDTAWDYSDGYVHIVVRETTPPTIDIQSPKKKDELAWKSYEIKWTDDDPDSNAKIKLYYNSPPYDIGDWVQIDLDEDGFITSNDVIFEDQDGDFDAYTWDISTFSEGVKFKVKAHIEDDDELYDEDESPGNIIITQIPAPTNLSIVDGKMVSVGVYETHDLYPQIEWERPDIALDMFFYGKIYEGSTNSGVEVFDINTSDTSVPVSVELVYGNTYFLELYAMSSLGALSPTTSMTFDVVNNLPSAPQIRISPAKPYASNSLRCEITNNSVDEDNDPVDYSYMWYKNGDHQPLYDDIANIPSDATSKTDVWKVVVTPFDGIEDGITSEVTVTILNSAPSITINSPGSGLKAKSSDMILFSGSISDFDTDTVEYKITSSIDGELESQTDPSGSGSFKLSKKLSPGEHNITIWASDGLSNVTKTFPVSISKADDGSDTEDAIWWALVIIVIVVVIIVALLVIRKRRRSGEEIPPPIEEYPAEDGEGDDAFDEYGEFKKTEEEAPEETTETPPPTPPETK
jgi:hypothetical protein